MDIPVPGPGCLPSAKNLEFEKPRYSPLLRGFSIYPFQGGRIIYKRNCASSGIIAAFSPYSYDCRRRQI